MKDEMIGRLQVKLGKTKEEMQKIIARLWFNQPFQSD
jgi:hypothetical protein